jgi:hypothetical protein
MDEVRKIGIIPIRYTELGLTIEGNPHRTSHVAFMNVPEAKMNEYRGDNKNVRTDIKEMLPYIKRTKCRLVLCHPRSLQEIQVWAPYIHGYEIMNGLDRYQRKFKNRDASIHYPEMVQFIGADYHVWKGMGDLDYFTELPDNWFGALHR